MYRLVLYLHVLSALAFMGVHGASIIAAFRIRRLANEDEVRTVLALSFAAIGAVYGTLALVIVTALILGFGWGWARQGWFWASGGVLLVMIVIMTIFGSLTFHRIRWAAGVTMGDPRRPPPRPLPTPGPGDLEAAIKAVKPGLLAATGFGGVAILVWLMQYKPF